jgi:S-DNA-T family DNA segregation ATPase FtsK/SpoIIIE
MPAVARPKKASIAYKTVRGADGQIIRQFSVDDLQEQRKVGKRQDELPPFDLLEDNDLNRPTDEEINKNARIIEETLREFDIHVEVVDIKIGPAVTQYAVQPFKEMINEEGERFLYRCGWGGLRAGARPARRYPPSGCASGPRAGTYLRRCGSAEPRASLVSLRGVMESATFYRNRSPLALPLGRDVSGASFVADLATMPHLLIAGTTGSGKSVALTAMTAALVMNNPPDRLKLVLLDPKMVELTRFQGLPHLLGRSGQQERIFGVLRWAGAGDGRRYKLLEVAAARNIEIYNGAGPPAQGRAPALLVIIFDEIGDLMLSRPEETEKLLAPGPDGPRGGYSPDGRHPAAVGGCDHRVDQGEFPARFHSRWRRVSIRASSWTRSAETLMGRDMLYQRRMPPARSACRLFVSTANCSGFEYWPIGRAAVAEGFSTPPVSP